MNIPEALYYSTDHEWLRIDGPREATIGITEFAAKELGDIVYLDITAGAEPVARNQVFGTIEAVKTVSDLFMPISGTVIEVNPKLGDTPELVNSDPYGEGWLIRISTAEPISINGLFNAKQYQSLIGHDA